jgi:HPt (histidine-containing phosphotransfer) domain-containing protein
MAALREHFAGRARREGEELRLLAGKISADDSACKKIKKIAHGLVGAAAIFGMPSVSTEAAGLEEAIDHGATAIDIASQSVLLAELLATLAGRQTA